MRVNFRRLAKRISRNKMSAFDLGECLHDPEFAPSRKGLANRFSAVHPRSSHVHVACTYDYICMQNRFGGFLLEKNSRFSLPPRRDKGRYAFISCHDIFYNHSGRFIACAFNCEPRSDMKNAIGKIQ